MSGAEGAVAGGGRTERQAWMALLARARLQELEEVIAALLPTAPYTRLRGPDTGLVMLRGRMGGTGQPFNLGEATVTRCTVQISGGEIGHAYLLGTDSRRAELAAVGDALMQVPAQAEALRTRLLAPLGDRLAAEREQRTGEREATRVEFFTMVRGEG